MTIREQIILDVLHISDQRLLLQLFDFLQRINGHKDNCAAVLAFAGLLSFDEGAQIARNLDNEFNQIEGEW